LSGNKIKIVYLLAASHSGSTLTAMLLGAHPSLTSVGELNAFRLGDPKNYLCSCMQKISDCDFWSCISQTMASHGENFSILDAKTNLREGTNTYESRLLKPLVRERKLEFLRDAALALSPSWRGKLSNFQRRNYLLIRSILEHNKTEFIVDSSKIGIRLKYLLRNPKFDVKVIWQVRDGRGVTLAYYDPSKFADSKDEKLRGGGVGKTFDVSREIGIGAHEWIRCNEEAINVLSTMDERNWLKVHYEDICEKTEETLDVICDFLEVDSNKKTLEFRSKAHHMVGNGMRLDSSSVIEHDERWRDVFTDSQLMKFEEVAGDFNRMLMKR
jgi:hypothetical protein